MANPLNKIIAAVRGDNNEALYGPDLRENIAKGFEVAGSGMLGDMKVIDISRDEYNKLSDEEKFSETVYFLTDDGVLMRNNIEYLKKLLPPEYKQVEYLYSNFSGWFNTGISYSSNNWSYEVDAEIEDGRLFSAKGATSGHEVCVGTNGTGEKVYAVSLSGGDLEYSNIPAGERCIFIVDSINKSIKIIPYNKELEQWSFNTLTGNVGPYGTTVGKYRIGAAHNDNLLGRGKIYRYTFYKDSKLIFDAYPCYRKADKEPGFYDIIGQTFVENVDIGHTKMFLPNEKEPTLATSADLPEGYTAIEFLESDGNQYIDLGEKSKGLLENLIINCLYKPVVTNERSIFGKNSRLMYKGYSYGAEWQFYDYRGRSVGLNDFSNTTVPERFRLQGGNIRTDQYVARIANLDASSPTDPNFDGPMYLFANNDGTNTAANRSSIRMYGFLMAKLVKTEIDVYYETMYNMIPCINETTDEKGMYDTVSGTFFRGAEAQFPYFVPVDSVVSYGGPYTDGLSLTYGSSNSLEVEIDCSFDCISNGSYVHTTAPFGWSDTSNALCSFNVSKQDNLYVYSMCSNSRPESDDPSISRITNIPAGTRCKFYIKSTDEENSMSVEPVSSTKYSKETIKFNNKLSWGRSFAIGANFYERNRSFSSMPGIFYGCKVWNDGVLKWDMRPYQNKANGEYGFMNLVDNKFYPSIVTRAGFVGEGFDTPKPLPDEYEAVEYIEASPGAYTDPGENTAGVIDSLILRLKWSIEYQKGRISGKGVNRENEQMIMCDYEYAYRKYYYFCPTYIDSPDSHLGILPDLTIINEYEAQSGGHYQSYQYTKDLSQYQVRYGGIPNANTYTDHSNHIYLFGVNKYGTPIRTEGTKRLWYFRLWNYQRTDAVRAYKPLVDAWPCKKKDTGEYGLYDFATERFLVNLGEGTFSGPDTE